MLREVRAGYQLGDLRGKVNHFLFIDDLKLYRQNEKQTDTLVNAVRIPSEDNGMEFAISNYATLTMKRGIISKNEGKQLLNDEFIKNIEDGDGYKYLGILEADEYPQADVGRFYIPWNNGGRGIISAEDYVEMETESLKKYVENSNERLLKAVEGEGILGDGKTKKEIPGEKEELHGKAIAFTVYGGATTPGTG